jgi:hypothetical protein
MRKIYCITNKENGFMVGAFELYAHSKGNVPFVLDQSGFTPFAIDDSFEEDNLAEWCTAHNYHYTVVESNVRREDDYPPFQFEFNADEVERVFKVTHFMRILLHFTNDVTFVKIVKRPAGSLKERWIYLLRK